MNDRFERFGTTKWLQILDSSYLSYSEPDDESDYSLDGDGGWVRALVSQITLNPKTYRVSVCGYGRDFDSKTEALDCFRSLPDVITHNWLRANGFVPA